MTTLTLARLYLCCYGNRCFDAAHYRTELSLCGVDTTRLERIARKYDRTYRLMRKRSPASWQYATLADIRRRLSDEADGVVKGSGQLTLLEAA